MAVRFKNVLLWLVAIGFFMETLDATIVNTALPSMAQTLGESPLKMQSVIISYALTLAIFIPASGWMADRFGIRRVFMSAITLFTIGSLLCAFSQNLPELVLSRVLQGAGGSMLLPIGRLAVLRAFPGPAFLEALGFVTMPALIGPLIGPTLGGWLVEIGSWHWIFLINIPIGIVGLIATAIAMPDDPPSAVARFDFTGFFQLAVSMVAISFALDGLSELHLPHAAVLMLFFLGLASLVAYILHASQVQSPLFSLKLFKIRTYSIGLLGNLFARAGSSGMPFLIPLFLQLNLGYSPLQAGLAMLPIAIAGIIAKKMVTPLIGWMGYRKFLMVNTFLVGVGMASFALISAGEPESVRIIQLFLFGFVNSMQFTAMNTLALKELDRSNSSSGNSLFSMVQMLAMSFAVAAASALLETFRSRFEVDIHPDQALHAFHSTFVCMGLITCTSTFIFWQISEGTRVTGREPEHLET
jgi:EmrB/QacA subfamily drug resistance transporter